MGDGAGGDVRDMASSGARSADERRKTGPATAACRCAPPVLRPVITAVDGVAFGAGMSLMLLADRVLLSERARLCMVFQRVGLIPN